MNLLSNKLLAEMMAQDSGDPFLTLVTLIHPDWDDNLRLVNNSSDLFSRGNLYRAFPVRITLPSDDGESLRQATLQLDNVSLEFIHLLRGLDSGEQIAVRLEMILASLPDQVQFSLEELRILSIAYDEMSIRATLGLDDFLNTEVSSERYTPSLYPGVF